MAKATNPTAVAIARQITHIDFRVHTDQHRALANARIAETAGMLEALAHKSGISLEIMAEAMEVEVPQDETA